MPRPPPVKKKVGRPTNDEKWGKVQKTSRSSSTTRPVTPPPKRPPEGLSVSPDTAAFVALQHRQRDSLVPASGSKTDEKTAQGRSTAKKPHRYLGPSRRKDWRVVTKNVWKFFDRDRHDWNLPGGGQHIADCYEIKWLGEAGDVLAAGSSSTSHDFRARGFTGKIINPIPSDLRPGNTVVRQAYDCVGAEHGDPATSSDTYLFDEDEDNDDADSGGPMQHHSAHDDEGDKDEPEDDLEDEGYVFEDEEYIFEDEGEYDSDEEVQGTGVGVLAMWEGVGYRAIDDEDDQEGEGDGDSTKKRRKKNARCNVQLKVEVFSNAPDKAVISQRGDHPPTPERRLGMSRHILRRLLDSYSRGTTAAVALKRIQEEQAITHEHPDYRVPDLKQVTNVIPTAKRRSHHDRNALRALEILGEKYPELVFINSPHIPGESELIWAAADVNALLHAVRYTRLHGIAVDSSWRHRNENGAPMTLIITIDKNLHAVPIASMLSENITAQTLTNFLASTRDKVVSFAIEMFANGESSSVLVTLGQAPKKRLLSEAQRIAKSGWQPCLIMIDQDRAEKKAIQTVFADDLGRKVFMRICQFHHAQNGLRWMGDVATKKKLDPSIKYSQTEGPAIPTRLEQEVKVPIMMADRRAQRCRDTDEDPWDEAWARFEAEVRDIGAKFKVPAKTIEAIIDYYRRNAFSDEWRRYIIDGGLPPGQTRDGVWNTNNFLEAMWRTFHRVFLELRDVKRIDTTGTIILLEFFPYYKYGVRRPPRPDQTYLEVTRAGCKIWEEGRVQELPEADCYAVLVYDEELQQPRRFLVNTAKPSCGPDCSQWKNTGKACKHMWGVAWYQHNGSVKEWDARLVETQNIDELPSDQQYALRFSDYEIDHDLDALADAIQATGDNTADLPQGVETARTVQSPSYQEASASSFIGRPAAIKSARPWRGKAWRRIHSRSTKPFPDYRLNAENPTRASQDKTVRFRQKRKPAAKTRTSRSRKPKIDFTSLIKQTKAKAALAATRRPPDSPSPDSGPSNDFPPTTVDDQQTFQLLTELEAKSGTAQLKYSSFSLASPHQGWVNDVSINAYCDLVNAYRSGAEGTAFHVVTTYCLAFYPDDLDRAVKHLGKIAKGNFFADGLSLVLPVHAPLNRPYQQRNHWAVLHVDTPNRKISYYDSLFNLDSRKQAFEALDAVLNTYSSTLPPDGAMYVPEEWEWLGHRKMSLQQANGLDCGVFAIGNIRRAVGLSDRIVTPENAHLARIHFALDLARWEIDSSGPSPSPSLRPLSLSPSTFELQQLFALRWKKSSCWLDTGIHLFSFAYRILPGVWDSCAEASDSVIGRFAKLLREYCNLLSNLQAISEPEPRVLAERDAATRLGDLRDSFRTFLAANGLGVEEEQYGTPFGWIENILKHGTSGDAESAAVLDLFGIRTAEVHECRGADPDDVQRVSVTEFHNLVLHLDHGEFLDSNGDAKSAITRRFALDRWTTKPCSLCAPDGTECAHLDLALAAPTILLVQGDSHAARDEWGEMQEQSDAWWFNPHIPLPISGDRYLRLGLICYRRGHLTSLVTLPGSSTGLFHDGLQREGYSYPVPFAESSTPLDRDPSLDYGTRAPYAAIYIRESQLKTPKPSKVLELRSSYLQLRHDLRVAAQSPPSLPHVFDDTLPSPSPSPDSWSPFYCFELDRPMFRESSSMSRSTQSTRKTVFVALASQSRSENGDTSNDSLMPDARQLAAAIAESSARRRAEAAIIDGVGQQTSPEADETPQDGGQDHGARRSVVSLGDDEDEDQRLNRNSSVGEDPPSKSSPSRSLPTAGRTLRTRAPAPFPMNLKEPSAVNRVLDASLKRQKLQLGSDGDSDDSFYDVQPKVQDDSLPPERHYIHKRGRKADRKAYETELLVEAERRWKKLLMHDMFRQHWCPSCGTRISGFRDDWRRTICNLLITGDFAVYQDGLGHWARHRNVTWPVWSLVCSYHVGDRKGGGDERDDPWFQERVTAAMDSQVVERRLQSHLAELVDLFKDPTRYFRIDELLKSDQNPSDTIDPLTALGPILLKIFPDTDASVVTQNLAYWAPMGYYNFENLEAIHEVLRRVLRPLYMTDNLKSLHPSNYQNLTILQTFDYILVPTIVCIFIQQDRLEAPVNDSTISLEEAYEIALRTHGDHAVFFREGDKALDDETAVAKIKELVEADDMARHKASVKSNKRRKRSGR